MTSALHTVNGELDKVDGDLSMLIRLLEQVLLAQHHEPLTGMMPWSANAVDLPAQQWPARASQVVAICFQLLNMVEENAAAQARRSREAEKGILAEHGLWGDQLHKLTKEGATTAELRELVSRVDVEAVLTAHPTEAKRDSVLEQHREIYLLMVKLENQMWTPLEREEIVSDLSLALERLWRTGEVLIDRPQVIDELENMLHYLREILPEAVHRHDARLRQAWKAAGHSEAEMVDSSGLPRIGFDTWVGGDRDGHPFVTPQVTQTTLLRLRHTAITVLDRELAKLADRLPLSRHVQSPSSALVAATEKLATPATASTTELVRVHGEEPWRLFTELLRHHLTRELQDAAAPMITVVQVRESLLLLRQSLVDLGATTLAQHQVDRVIRSLDVFGLHLAQLDIRQNSRMHDEAVAQLLVAAGIDGATYPDWSEDKRLSLLNKELLVGRPFTLEDISAGNQADVVLGALRVAANYRKQFGGDGIGALIVSMTRQVSDLLGVYVLGREAGLATMIDGGLVSQVPVVPLFETLEDLERAPSILDAFLAHPVTLASLKAQAQARGLKRPRQQVMIGYSDSNKDGGIIASQWALHVAQWKLAQVARKHGVELLFFHGRGGTISRGAGPTDRFLHALPHGSLGGALRLTEQGETIAQKYANLITGTYHLELLTAGVAGTTYEHEHSKELDPTREPIMEKLAQVSREAYLELTNEEGFFDFFNLITPIDVLVASGIGSRPPRRTGRSSLGDLRAIPWVFSWSQSRFFLPGWFGVGNALQQLALQSPEQFAQLKKRLPDWPFVNYVLTNVESMLASADEQIMRLYATLVKDETLRERLLGHIINEWRLSRDMIEQLFGSPIAQRRPRLVRSMHRRLQPLETLHKRQVYLLDQWRHRPAGESNEEGAALFKELLLTVNAIAGGLRTTG